MWIYKYLCVYTYHLVNIYIYIFVGMELLSHMVMKIQPVHSEGDQPWDFFERNDAKAETPVLWPPHAKS